MPTAHAEHIAQCRPDPWAEERGEALNLIAQCTPSQAGHQLYRKVLAIYEELFSLRAQVAGLERENQRLQREEVTRTIKARGWARRWKRVAKRLHRQLHIVQENAERMERIAIQFANQVDHNSS